MISLSSAWRIARIALAIFGPAIPLLVSDTCADALRWSGMWYQLAGLGVVVWGLNDRPKALGLASGLASLRSGFTGGLARVRDRILRRPPPPTMLEATGHVNLGVFARAQLKATGTPEERFDRLEDQLYRLEGEMEDKIRKAEADAARRVEAERLHREKAIEQARLELRGAFLGNTGLDLLGVALFVAGTVFSSIAPSF